MMTPVSVLSLSDRGFHLTRSPYRKQGVSASAGKLGGRQTDRGGASRLIKNKSGITISGVE